MTVKRWNEREIMDRGESCEYVKAEDFDRVFSAFRAFFDAVESDILDMQMGRRWSIIEAARKIVDQYE